MSKKTFLVILILTVFLTTMVHSADFPITVVPGDNNPSMHLLSKTFDIGADVALSYDVTANPTDNRRGNYAFTGEQINEVVLVRDMDGAVDIGDVNALVEGLETINCSWIPPGPALDAIIAGYGGGLTYNVSTDKAFNCTIIVDETWYGYYFLSINASVRGESFLREGIAQMWFFNPAVVLNLASNNQNSSIVFEDWSPGYTVYSTNKLIVRNELVDQPIGVEIWAWLSSDDLSLTLGSFCPTNETLQVEDYMEYRGKKGTYIGDWEDMANPDMFDGCLINGTCQGAKGIVEPGVEELNRLGVDEHAEIEFRLHYPLPCTGNVTGGDLHVVARAV